ncbi:MAG: polysaccharide deacetylase family protein [Fimbriimonas sp.]|nr:polysaccharide deacetylase family protein [Fimbriimonas sp.]
MKLVILLATSLHSAGCSMKVGHTDPPVASAIAQSASQESEKRVTNQPGNTMGRVFIVMYHHFKPGHGDLYRTPTQFRHDLETYYDMGFRPVLASEYLANKMPLPSGAMPIILTFDDSNPTQVHFLADGSLDPKCALGVWKDFAETHPDFPVHGTFFVLPGEMWGQLHKYRDKKIQLVLSMGSEIESHTMTHPFLNRLTDARVERELGDANITMEKFGQKPPISLALPYGVLPRHTQCFYGFKWKGQKIHFSGVFLAAGPPARSPIDPKIKRFRIPRMAGNWEGDAVGYWLKELKKGKIKSYVQP